MVKSFFKYINIIQKSAPPLIVDILCCYIHSMLSSPGFEISWLYAFSIIWQRWSNIFGFNSDLNLFPRILNILIQIREFWRPNNIRIFLSFSSNLEYLKHIFLLLLNLNWEFLGDLRRPIREKFSAPSCQTKYAS